MKTNTLTLLTGFVLMTAFSVSSWASGSLPSENPLGDQYYDEVKFPRIDFEDSYLAYVPGRKGKRPGKILAGAIGSSFTLVTPTLEEVEYSGFFSMKANISSSGELLGGKFSFRSSDEMFGFGTKEVCWWGRCKEVANTGNVFSGVLTDIGWSSNSGILEFAIGELSGWGCDVLEKCTEYERMWFDLGSDSLMNLTDAIADRDYWVGKADGTAVIPVPAAAWLFGTGLIGLVGFARRKRSAIQ